MLERSPRFEPRSIARLPPSSLPPKFVRLPDLCHDRRQHYVRCASYFDFDPSDFIIRAVFGYIVAIAFLALVVWSIVREIKRRRRLAKMSAVQEEMEYPNNHHVLGVGYYHAASGRWYRHPWNEFREGRGFFWNGRWNPSADHRLTDPTMPEPGEILRVNAEWRRADPDKMEAFWSHVDRFGFGGATHRSEGS